MNALKVYKASRWCYLHKIPLLPKILGTLNTLFYSCKIPYKVPIGDGTKFAAGGMCLNLNAQSIGENCVIGTMVVMMRSFPYKKLPKIGNRVYISHGVKIMGPVVIEDNVLISANSVVTKSIPRNAIVAGVPARIIGYMSELPYDPFDNPKYDEGIKPFLKDNRVLDK